MQTQLKKAGESMDRRLEHMRTEFSEEQAEQIPQFLIR